MAGTAYGVNAPEAVKLWSRQLFKEALKETWFGRFVGKGSDNLIQVKSETSKGAGDTVTVTLRTQLTGDGVQGDGTLEGQEEGLTTFTDKVVINQLRHAVRSKGKMSEQRVPFDIREEAKDGLKDWWAGRLDVSFFNQLAGNVSQSDGRFTGNQAAIAPDVNHQLWANVSGTITADEALTATDVFNLKMIDRAVEAAKTLDPSTAAGLVPVRPLRIKGEDKYVMFVHPYQVTDLRTSTSTGQWLDIQKAAMTGGDVSKNPIYTGALGEYNGVILHEAYRVPQGCNSTTGAAVANTRRAVLCGAQACCIAFGQGGSETKMDWVEEMFDYGNQLGVAAGLIFGIKKTRFNGLDFGTIVASSYAAKH